MSVAVIPASPWGILPSDRTVLRELAERKIAVAHDAENVERRRLWYALDDGFAERPMVLAESWVSFEDMPDSNLVCQEEWARDIEKTLRFEIFQFEQIGDDHVVEPHVNVNWDVTASDYGVEVRQEYAERVSGNISSRHWDPPIKDLDRDLDKLRPRAFSVNREKTWAWKAFLDEVFAGILDVRIRGGFWWTTGMTQTAVDLIGLEPLMENMCMNPGGLHRLMAFLRDDCLAYAEWLEDEGLLSLNNENDYIGSGSMGYTRALPKPDRKPCDPVQLKDLWVLSESQETVLCGPAQFEEFVFQYQQPVIEQFGRCYYGCCEPVHSRWPYLKKLGNLKRLSISPWCDQEHMAEALGRNYVFSRKPNPTLVSVSDFDEDLIRKDLQHTLAATRDCNVEIIMKDVHTLCGHPERLARWVQIAREMIENA